MQTDRQLSQIQRAPSLRLLAREGPAMAYMHFAATLAPPVQLAVDGGGHKVMILPGFMASDHSVSRLHRSLNMAGFDSYTLGLGRNFGVDAKIFDRIDARLDGINADGPITMIGWSLGGLIAREYAKRQARRVAKVITLGSPFSGNPRANNAWRMYERVAGYKVDAPPIEMVLCEKPPVPTTAMWSRRDGIIAPECARGMPHESDIQIELSCTHMTFSIEPAAIAAIASAVVADI
jgi:pimeloyl-ACP methyl ester carboxylesterase